MKEAERQARTAAVHANAAKGVFYVTGGGSLLLSDLLTTPGASATVLETTVPYAQSALADLLGWKSSDAAPQACSADTARAMAMRAFLRATVLADEPEVFGFAITASLRTTDAKRGDHRAHFALQTSSSTSAWFLPLNKGARSRAEEERLVADVALYVLDTATSSSSPAIGADIADKDILADLQATTAQAEPELHSLMLNSGSCVGTPGSAFMPGAFNPLHDGHRQMRAVAQRRLGQPVQYELCVRNVDKPPLDYIEIAERRAQFEPGDLVLTNAPTFVAKAAALGKPGKTTTFIVGADTITRVGEPRYYGTAADRDAALEELTRLGTRFLVFGRVDGERFTTLDDLSVPEALRRMCDGVPEAEFRADVSSTELRES